MFKIQVTATNEGAVIQAPPELTQWADMEDLPPFNSVREAEQWMTENKTQELERYGLKFRIVEADGQADNIPEIEIVSAADIDPEILEEIETQLLSAELDEQGDPRITFHANGEKMISELLDEETLEMLDADWDEAKAAGKG